MIRAATKVISCLDHTKFGRRSVSPLCDLEQIDIDVTDDKSPRTWWRNCVQRGSK